MDNTTTNIANTDDTAELDSTALSELLDDDEPPTDGTWTDTDDTLGTLTVVEAERGHHLGQTIDTGNDTDAG